MSSPSALIIGATGAAGGKLLNELLASNHFARVGAYGRRVIPAEQLGTGKEKLEQKVIDFEKLDDAGLKDGKWDVVYITLGTTRAIAGSAAAFEKIDRDYVVNAARAAKDDDPDHPQRIVYLSSTGANPTSRLLYPRSKGLTEQGLASLGYSDTVVFRPGFLKGAERGPGGRVSLGEKTIGVVTGAMSLFTPNVEIQVPLLAKSMYLAGKMGSGALPASTNAKKIGKEGEQFTVIENAGAVALAKAES